MTCKFCGATELWSEHLPTEEGSVYQFACNTMFYSDDHGWLQSWRCKAKLPREEA